MKTFVLDTSVLIHDPNCLESFQDNHVRIPVEVIHEVDKLKTEPGERGRAARSVQRKLLAIFGQKDLTKPTKTQGGGTLAVILSSPDKSEKGKTQEEELLQGLGKMDQNDHFIIAAAYRLQKGGKGEVALISKDMGMILKARTLGLKAEDYKHDKTEEIPNGTGKVLPAKDHEVQAFASCGEILLQPLARKENAKINQYVVLGERGIPARHKGDGSFIKLLGHQGLNIPEGIHIRPLNLGQEFLLDALLDPNIALVTVRGPAGTGKAQPLYSKIATPSGWKTMGETKMGDPVLTPDGKVALVDGIFPQGPKTIWEIEFIDGRKIECCEDHLWEVFDDDWRQEKHRGKKLPRALSQKTGWRTITTKEIHRIISKTKKDIFVPTPTVEYKRASHPIHPYWLGAMLGDGSIGKPRLSISNSDTAVLKRLKKTMHPDYELVFNSGCDWHITQSGEKKGKKGSYYPKELKKLGLWGTDCFTKFIPETYLFGTRQQRLHLLEGLLDTDGEVDKGGCIIFSTSSKKLRDDTQMLCWSLGYMCSIGKKTPFYSYKGKKRKGATNYRLYIRANDPTEINLISRKKKGIPRNGQYKNRIRIQIKKVRKTRRITEMQCISVNHPQHLYITDNHIVTHNTLLSLAAGLFLKHQKAYNQVIVTKPIVSMGKDLGALPGTLEEKMKPWLQPYSDALDFLFRGHHKIGDGPQEKPQSPRKMNRQQGRPQYGSSHGGQQAGPPRPKKPYDRMIEDGSLQIEALTYIRGRSIPNAFFIMDECLTLDTLVWTDDGKALPIDELQPNDGVTSYNLGTQKEEPDKIQGKIRRTTKWATKVQTTAGTLEGSTNHPLWVYHQGAILCKKWMWDVLPGDLIPIAEKMPHVVKNNFQEKEAALAALIICDGHISQQGYTLQCEMSKDQEWLKTTWIESTEILETEYNCIKPTKRGTTLCRAYGKETIRKWAESLGIPSGKKSHKVRVPQQIWNAPEESVKTFLRICFDCEGDVNPGTTGASINFNSTSRRLALEIQQLLRKFGIVSNTHKIPKKGATSWRVTITGEDIESYLQNVGFSIPRKQAALQKICKTIREDVGSYPIAAIYEIRAQKCGTAPRLTFKTRTSIQKIELEAHTRLRTDKITSITKRVFDKIQNVAKARGFTLQDYPRCARVKHVETRKHIKEVVDFKVEKNATFIANGLVTSNCQNLSPIESKTILTRIGKGSKIILLGDEDQIDNPYLDKLSNGLTYVRTRMDDIRQAAHVHLTKGERSEISEIAAKLL